MSVKIVFSGLCSFLNPKNNNTTMPEPSVIVLRTDLSIPLEHSDEHGHAHNDFADIQIKHIPFLAFDSRKVLVSDARGFQRASRVDPLFWFRELDGVLLKIEGFNAKPLTVDPSFDRVVSRDKYWPGTENQWNRAFVPVKGELPLKSAVHAFLRFGGGILSAGRLSRVQWQFVIPEKPTYIDYFAEEVSYSDFLAAEDKLVIKVLDLTTEREITTLQFTSRDDRSDGSNDIVIFIGNNTEQGIKEGFLRRSDENAQPSDGRHMVFLNQVASPHVRIPAPIPVPVPKPDPVVPGTVMAAGGSSSGFCGPGNANG